MPAAGTLTKFKKMSTLWRRGYHTKASRPAACPPDRLPARSPIRPRAPAGPLVRPPAAAGETAAGKIAVGEIAAGEIVAGEIAAGEIVAGEIAAREIAARGTTAEVLHLHVMLVVEMEAPDGKNKSHSVTEPRKRWGTNGVKSKPGEERLF